MLSEGKETMRKPYGCPCFLSGTLSRQQNREKSKQSTEVGRQGSEPERLRELEVVSGKEGARKERLNKEQPGNHQMNTS